MPWDLDEGRERYRLWTVANGVRDTVEAVSRFLESVRIVLAVWGLGTRQEEGEVVRGEDWQEMIREGKRFHRMGLPAKMEYLADTYSFQSDAESARQMLSINKLRNCLVHRGGVVGTPDVDHSGCLALHLLRLVLIVTECDEEREVQLPAIVQAGETIKIRSEPTTLHFKLGQRVELSADDFTNAAWTTLTFGNLTISALQQYGRDRGYVQGAEEDPAFPRT